MRACALLLQRRGLATAAAVPSNYSNTPFKKVDERPAKKPTHAHPSSGAAPRERLPVDAVMPSPMQPTILDPTPAVTSINKNYLLLSYRRAACSTTDVSMRPQQPLHAAAEEEAVAETPQFRPPPPISYGDVAPSEVSCRWAAKFYGQVTFGPRNFPYSSSRWLARRFRMKKHRILKRFRFRRYKLAAVANLPFAKMIRVGMLPELKSSKTKKGDAVESGLASQLVSTAQASTGGKVKGRRPRPKSKYQV